MRRSGDLELQRLQRGAGGPSDEDARDLGDGVVHQPGGDDQLHGHGERQARLEVDLSHDRRSVVRVRRSQRYLGGVGILDVDFDKRIDLHGLRRPVRTRDHALAAVREQRIGLLRVGRLRKRCPNGERVAFIQLQHAAEICLLVAGEPEEADDGLHIAVGALAVRTTRIAVCLTREVLLSVQGQDELDVSDRIPPNAVGWVQRDLLPEVIPLFDRRLLQTGSRPDGVSASDHRSQRTRGAHQPESEKPSDADESIVWCARLAGVLCSFGHRASLRIAKASCTSWLFRQTVQSQATACDLLTATSRRWNSDAASPGWPAPTTCR